jgi:hypothetical protein
VRHCGWLIWVLRDFPPGNAEMRYELGVHTDRELRCHLHDEYEQALALARALGLRLDPRSVGDRRRLDHAI